MFLKSGAMVLALLLASRLLGLVRESAQAAAFGTSGLGDVAVLMLSLPDLLAGLLASGALAYVLLPYWARVTDAQRDLTQRRVALWLLAAGAILGIALWAAQGVIVHWLASGLSATLRPAAAQAMVWSALAVPAALLAALWVTRLQHDSDFVGMYAANLVVNAVLVMALFQVATSTTDAWTLQRVGIALLMAMLARLAWLRWRMPGRHLRNTASGSVPLPPAGVWIGAALAAGLPLALPFAARSIASQSGEGALAAFNYAWKLVELPLMLAIQLVASLAFPAIARVLADASEAQPATDATPPVRSAFALAWTLACAAAAGLLVAAPSVAQLLFGWGRMSPDGLVRVAEWGRAGAWGLLPQALIAVAMTVLATQNRLRAAVWAYVTALFVLLLAGASGLNDGAALMWLLNSLLLAVALVLLWALGDARRHWVPWQALWMPALVLGAVAVSQGAGLFVIFERSLPAALGFAFCIAIITIASGWWSAPDLRRALRR